MAEIISTLRMMAEINANQNKKKKLANLLQLTFFC